MAQTDFDYGWNVAQDDVPTYDQSCMGMMVCPHCGKAAMCGDVAKLIGENMIPRTTPNNPRQSGGKRKPNGLPFLSKEHANHAKQPGKVVAARLEDDNFRKGEQVVTLKVEFREQHYLYNLRTNNPTLDSLIEAWGDDETTWNNKPVVIFNEEDDFNGKTWLRIEPSDDTTETGKTRKR